MNLNENIDRIKEMMDEGKDAYVSRSVYDQEYEEEYPKWGKIIIKFLEMEINSYYRNEHTITLLNDKNLDQILIRYHIKNESLWWDYSLKEMLEKFIPYGYISRHFKYAVQDYFKNNFPEYGIREIQGANIG